MFLLISTQEKFLNIKGLWFFFLAILRNSKLVWLDKAKLENMIRFKTTGTSRFLVFISNFKFFIGIANSLPLCILMGQLSSRCPYYYYRRQKKVS
jgi:hypothetical protein